MPRSTSLAELKVRGDSSRGLQSIAEWRVLKETYSEVTRWIDKPKHGSLHRRVQRNIINFNLRNNFPHFIYAIAGITEKPAPLARSHPPSMISNFLVFIIFWWKIKLAESSNNNFTLALLLTVGRMLDVLCVFTWWDFMPASKLSWDVDVYAALARLWFNHEKLLSVRWESAPNLDSDASSRATFSGLFAPVVIISANKS